MTKEVYFRKFNGQKIENIEEYVNEYTLSHPDVEIMIGTDSQNRGDYTYYSTVIALYNPRHGAHCIYKKWKTERERNRPTRLMNEVWYSVELAEYLMSKGVKKPKYIDIDVNPSPKYKSNEVYPSATGLIEGMGYEVRYKTLCPLVTTMADWVVKH